MNRLIGLMLISTLFLGIARSGPLPVVTGPTLNFAAQHDPAVIEMDNGDRYSVHYPKGAWGRVDKWVPGRVLDLVYSEKDGAGLRDQLTQEILPLTDWPEGKHPLDIQFDVMMQNALSTQEIVEAYDAFIPKWEIEVARCYRLLKALPELSKKDRQQVMSAEKAWKQFYASQVEALAAVYYSRDGTLWRVEAASVHLRLVRNQALQLFAMLDYAPIDAIMR